MQFMESAVSYRFKLAVIVQLLLTAARSCLYNSLKGNLISDNDQTAANLVKNTANPVPKL